VNHSAAHTELKRAIRLDLGLEPDVVLFDNPRGHAVNKERKVHVSFGLVDGAGDLIGIGPGGRFTSIEVKTGKGVMTEEQLAFHHMVLARGGISGCAHSVAEARALIEAARL
jgi:hypothetical protein